MDFHFAISGKVKHLICHQGAVPSVKVESGHCRDCARACQQFPSASQSTWIDGVPIHGLPFILHQQDPSNWHQAVDKLLMAWTPPAVATMSMFVSSISHTGCAAELQMKGKAKQNLAKKHGGW
ncbi:unnamed protein product [Urochloa humidicola]